MKVLLTLFVLLFSIPAHSSDDLTGNKIVCSKVMIGGDMQLAGFNFNSKYEVYYYQASNKMPTEISIKRYQTTPEEIRVEPYRINRKNLSVTRDSVEKFNEVSFQYENGECRLHDASIQDFISKKLEKYKEGNLLWEHS